MPFQCGDAKSQTEKVRIWVNEIINVQIPSILQLVNIISEGSFLPESLIQT